MSCILRIAVDERQLEWIEQGPLKPYRIDRKGETVIHIDVSKADFEDLPGQVRDAITFLETNAEALRDLIDRAVSSEPVLDFGVAERDVAVQVDRLPAKLLKLAGDLGMGIELSRYGLAAPVASPLP